jgi:DNA polymerase theta
MLYSKIRFIEAVGVARSSRTRIQIVALSATMHNVEQLASWFDASFFRTDFRPVPLQEYIRAGNSLYSSTGDLLTIEDSNENSIYYLCKEGIMKGQQILLFCGSKIQCETTCKTLIESFSSNHQEISHAGNPLSELSLINERIQLIETFLCSKESEPYAKSALMRSCLMSGIAYHHSDVPDTLRGGIEKAYKSGILTIIVATSTLATGVNLPAGRVLVKGMQIGRDILSVVVLKQMNGRAGIANTLILNF